MFLPVGWIYIAQGPCLFGDFYYIFLPNVPVGEGQKKALPFEHGARGTVPRRYIID